MNEPKWTMDDIPDQTGRVAVVTGASSGIGMETAGALGAKNARVILAVRDLEKGAAAVAWIRARHDAADVEVSELDLARLDSVRAFAGKFASSHERLDLLVNNAGVMAPPLSRTADGFELQFGTNHLGHFALTGLLMKLLKKTPGSRIVTVSSNAHRFGRPDFGDPHWERRRYSPWRAYGDSKLANLLFTHELQRRLSADGGNPVAAAAHPGYTATDLQRHSALFRFLNRFLGQEAPMGALPTLYAGTAPEVRGGEYYGPDGRWQLRGFPRRVASDARARDGAAARQLWELSERLTGVIYPD